MRRSSTVSRGRRWTGTLALAGAAVASLLAAAPSQANFTTGKCQGTDIVGRGASFAAAAHATWKTDFQDVFCADVGVFPNVTYEAQGSGAGRRVVGERTGTNSDGSQSRNQVPRFGMTDEPPTPTGISQMNQGTDAAGDEGTIHVIPGAVGSVIAEVNWPNNCDRALLDNGSETNPSAANANPFNDRARFTRTEYEEIWNGDSAHDQWHEIFPELASDSDCTGFITRVVRFDDSGTSFAFKDFLDRVNPTRNWDPGFTTGPDTRNWPNASLGPRADCPGSPTGPQGAHLTSGCANGNGSLTQKLLATDGSVGYSDIATARTNGLAITPTSSAGSRDDDVYWTQVTNQSGTFVEGTEDPNGFMTTGQKGANCHSTTFQNVPGSTLGDWSSTSGADSPQGWVICTLTYGLVFDDYKGPYALQGCGTACEEQKARSVKDYWQSIVSDSGQEVLFQNDYAELPTNILNIARNGVNQVCWDKPGTGPCPAVNYNYIRPAAAVRFQSNLVPTFNECTASSPPNRTHGPPLSGASCNPPALTSGQLIPGVTNHVSSIKYAVVEGNSSTSADEADVKVNVSITDVRNQAGLTDYTGEVLVTSVIRITDRLNGVSKAQPGTMQDTPLSATVQCVAQPGAIGGSCSTATSFDAIVPGAVPETKRSVWQLGQVTVGDGGPDGDVQTGPNTVFAKQGIFIP